MKLWKISQHSNQGYDTYDSAVVAADDEEAARKTSPGDYRYSWDLDPTWCNGPDLVHVEYLGEAAEGTDAGVIVASFNAG